MRKSGLSLPIKVAALFGGDVVRLEGTRSATNTIDLDTTLDAGAPTPVWTLTFAANGETVVYNTADFSHTVTAAQAGDYTLTLGPESIYDYVTYFDANSNGLTGTIADTRVTRMRNLTQLYLYNNSLSGSIPTELGNLSSLTRLYLYINSLSGSIPTELGNLSSLTRLYLHINSLSGSIPTELGNLSSLTQLYLYINSLSGSIPTELGNLSSLTGLRLDNNSLSGSIPTELGNLSSLTGLYLHINSLSGSIPTELGNLSSLRSLQLNNNSLDGPESGALQGEALDNVRLDGNSWTPTEVDDALWDLYQGALTRTATNGTINVGGGNSAPTGTVQAATSCPVDTNTPGGEVAHELANDGCAEGFNVWATVTVTT